MNVIGLSLSQARELLGELLGERAIEVVETAPPWEPRHYTPIWGEWRVVRTRERTDGQLELLVARELLREDRGPQAGDSNTETPKTEPPAAPD